MEKKETDIETIEPSHDLTNISRVLRESKKAIIDKDYNKLSYLSNETIHSATTDQNSMNIIVAVLVYSLSKVFQRENYQMMEGWKEFNKRNFALFYYCTFGYSCFIHTI